MGRTHLVLRLARLHFLVPGFLLYVLGYLVAVLGGAANDLGRFVFGYLIFAPAHLSLSFSNDYFDWNADRNSSRTTFSGGSRVLIEHPELKKFALTISIALLLVSFVEAAIFTLFYAYSLWFFVLVLVGGLAGFFYAAPPLRFSYRGLGEIATVLAIGIIMPGMGYFAASGFIDSLFAMFVPPISCYGLLFILTVELPDVASDRGSKVNMVVRWGEKAGMAASVIATALGTLFLALIYFSGALQGKIDIGPILLFSLFPLFASLFGLRMDVGKRDSIVRQVKINMTGMLILLFLMDLILLLQIFS